MSQRSSTLRDQRRNVKPVRYAGDLLTDRYRANLERSSLLSELDTCLHHSDISLRAVAVQDSLFLQYDFNLVGSITSLEGAYRILDLTTALLFRLQDVSGASCVPWFEDSASCDNFKCQKFIANLEHLLRCLRQIAQDAIVGHCVGFVVAHILHWHKYWQNQKRLGEGWFAEWPNGQHPLSTTWPWNIKPSLLVLWGVCWMFYGQSSNPIGRLRETRNRRGAATGVELSGDFRTRHIGSYSQPAPLALQPGSQNSVSD